MVTSVTATPGPSCTSLGGDVIEQCQTDRLRVASLDTASQEPEQGSQVDRIQHQNAQDADNLFLGGRFN